ncbi:MAG: hypothetical protein M1838_002845 [Thelocarpon superellum]|nr:MAG: hypothetical protein M1838_002845 [Thelocarpon superellum]
MVPKLNTSYQVHPSRDWEDLKQFRRFEVKGTKFSVDDDVLVNHPGAEGSTLQSPPAERELWVAHVAEIRACSAKQVFLRVLWFYWPEDLPKGAELYHGKDELVASNHMDIIDVKTVSGPTKVEHWREDDADAHLSGLYWRQTFNVETQELSENQIQTHCFCNAFSNPDKVQVECTGPNCTRWLHEECIVQDAIQRACHERLTPRKLHRGMGPISPHALDRHCGPPSPKVAHNRNIVFREPIGFEVRPWLKKPHDALPAFDSVSTQKIRYFCAISTYDALILFHVQSFVAHDALTEALKSGRYRKPIPQAMDTPLRRARGRA